MKTLLMLALSLFALAAQAQTPIKEQMLERVDLLLSVTRDARTAVKDKNYFQTCEKVSELFRILPDHLLSLGIRLNQFEGKAVRMIQETHYALKETHRKKNLCDAGKADTTLFIKGEPERAIPGADMLFKFIEKQLVFQKKKLPKMETDYRNYFNYSYEFN